MEKFALLNLLKALETLSPKQNPEKQPEPAPQPTPAEPPVKVETPNVMASVLERHEAIANRVRSKHNT